jgi:hypothetical protein
MCMVPRSCSIFCFEFVTKSFKAIFFYMFTEKKHITNYFAVRH